MAWITGRTFVFLLFYVVTPHVCSAGGLFCWGGMESPIKNSGIDGKFGAYSVSGRIVCAQEAKQGLICWGDPTRYDHWIMKAPKIHVSVVEIDSIYGCALDLDGYPTCWGHPDGEVSPPLIVKWTQFKSLSLSSGNACGVTREGAVRCWGRAARNNPKWLADLPKTNVGEVGVNGLANRVCWSSERDLKLNCLDMSDQSNETREYTMLSRAKRIIVHASNVCAVETDGALICYGSGVRRQSDVADYASGADPCWLDRSGSPHCHASANVKPFPFRVSSTVPNDMKFSSIEGSFDSVCGALK